MKTRKILLFILLLSVMLLYGTMNTGATNTESLPTTLDAPEIILYDNGYYNSELYVKAKTPDSVINFYKKGYLNRIYSYDTYSYSSDYGNYYLSGIAVQFDYKIDDGNWHYESDWDTSLYNSSSYDSTYCYYADELYFTYFSSYNTSDIYTELSNAGCVSTTTDGSYTYYRFDQTNHKISVRVRYFATVRDNNSNTTIILSDWSNTASLGNGEKDVSNVATSLSAPVISNLEIYGTGNYYGAPEGRFEVTPSDNTIDAMMWSEQYDEDLESSRMFLIVETSLDKNFGENSTICKESYSQNSSLSKFIDYDSIFYNLWDALPDKDQSAFNWNGETLYLRVKYKNSRTYNDSDSSIESPYSNVLSLEGPVIKKYDINITHNEYGFDENDYYSESYSKTEGRSLNTVYCSPLEGCYVDKVEINNVVKYDKSNESTYELLDWNSNYTYFDFLNTESTATKDLNIVITYAGTPTAKYGITTECGEGGYLTTDANYVSWNDNSLVVYHSTTPTIYIHPYSGFEIDTVTVDGVVNTDAKTNKSYKFDAIDNNEHNIKVTFKRVAWHIDSYAYHGTITTDYEGYSESEYVKIGDDITFTFEPATDASGNYYEIEKVYIDYVLNEEAKIAGTYTFTNVQADHSINVYYSQDPVITHDITATSGENGSISPEGIVHARENYTKTFYFYPDEGYEVDKVYVDDVEITNLATKEYYNIANVTEEHSIHVTFKKMPVQYKINVLVSGDNPSVQTVNPAGETPVWEGESFTVNYNAFTGYEIDKVLVDNSSVTANGTYTISSVSKNTTIEIFFKIKNYTVTFVDYDNTVLKKETIAHGSQATPPADPVREHYVFNGWDTTYSDVTTNVTIKAQYSPATYKVKFIGWDGTELKTENVKYTESATAPEAPVREGYDFSRWSIDYSNVSSNLEVVAVYTKKEYIVTFVDSDETIISTQTIKHGEAAELPADPVKEGYTFIGWDNLGYGYITNNMTITAQYVEGTKTIYTITTATYGTYGTVSPYGITKIVEDGSVTIYFYPDELSKIAKVVVDDVEIELCESYEFTNVSANHTLDVYFVPTATINVKTDEILNGTANGHYDLLDDQMVYVLDVTADEGYEFDGIYVNGTLTDVEYTNGQYILRNISDDMNIDVKFKKIGSDSDSKDISDETDSNTKNTSDETDNNTKDTSNKNNSNTKDASDKNDKSSAKKSNSNSGNDSEDITTVYANTPKTGDSSNLVACLFLLFMASIGIGISLKKMLAR